MEIPQHIICYVCKQTYPFLYMRLVHTSPVLIFSAQKSIVPTAVFFVCSHCWISHPNDVEEINLGLTIDKLAPICLN